jgi:glycosyltransferase involved in cell wall biosynthesis
MAERLTFLFGKDPATSHAGDVTMFRIMREIAEERYETEVICLSDQPHEDELNVVRVPKTALRLPSLVVRSVAHRRSLVHTRFDVDGLRDAVDQSAADRFVAMHCHLAESYLRSRRAQPAEELLINNESFDSSVWPRMYGLAGRVEARRLGRDERRVTAAARSVGCYNRGEMEECRAAGLNTAWLPLTLPPAERLAVRATPPRLVLVGNRTWLPNEAAAETMLRLWPTIADGLADAELWLVGQPPNRRVPDLPPGVVDLGAVDDIGGVLAQCRAMAAPVAFGGGVRVKLLESAARGLPVVATPGAVGALEATIGITAARDDDEFVARCRTYLLDADLAAQEGARLHDQNAVRWQARVGQDAVLEWLGA